MHLKVWPQLVGSRRGGIFGLQFGFFDFRFGLQPVRVWEFNPNELENYFGSVQFSFGLENGLDY